MRTGAVLIIVGVWVLLRTVRADSSGRTLVDRVLGKGGGSSGSGSGSGGASSGAAPSHTGHGSEPHSPPAPVGGIGHRNIP